MDNMFKLLWMVCATIILVCITTEAAYWVERDSAFSCTFHRGGSYETVINP